MHLLNHIYKDATTLQRFIENEQIPDGSSTLIQLFSSNIYDEELLKVRKELTTFLPSAALIGTSTAGIINDGDIIDNAISISFSIFEHSTVNAKSYCHLTNDEIIQRLSKDLITKKTKLLLCFANTFTQDAESLLQLISKQHPSLIIAGGNGADDMRFEKCTVFSGSCFPCDVSFAAINSDVLTVRTESLFNWRTIGKELTVTKAEGTRLYELDNKPVVDVYQHYLGKEIADDLLVEGIEFPLIYNNNGIDIARAPVAIHEDGSITLAGSFEEGTKVRFGYADVEQIDAFNKNEFIKIYPDKMEGIYIYSCVARRMNLGKYLDDEISIVQNIAPTSGFITYGEFFHDMENNRNCLLNITSTLVMLNENELSEKLEQKYASLPCKNKTERRLKALTTLVSRTSEELDENIFYLKQFQNAVDEVSIFSVTDTKGIIKDTNKNFETISGYSRDELIGKPHNIVRHPDMPKKAFEEMWETIQSGKIWKGVVKNRNKNGQPYYVLTEVSPIYNKDGSLKEYIGVRNDITELEEYKEILKTELDSTKQSMYDRMYYAQQYEQVVNANVAVLKTDTNNIITFSNQTFCNLMRCDLSELVGRDSSEIRHKKHIEELVCSRIRKSLENDKMIKETLTNIAKDGSEFTVDTAIYPIFDTDGNVIQFLQIMHDVTDIINLTEEIINTQKEVVLTMGSIGETRSKETGLHVNRVAEYSYLLAKLAGLDENEAELIKQASPMHDIGKVGIPDYILNKPDRLTDGEFEIMKTHAALGFEMLKHSERSILKASSIIALTHHEKWDGTGYPNSLKGDEIHIYGRITAIADVFDALGHDRIYKKAWELEKILALFKEESGKHFDPSLVHLFFKNLDQFLAIKIKFDDKF